jgi:hypothetical protein
MPEVEIGADERVLAVGLSDPARIGDWAAVAVLVAAIDPDDVKVREARRVLAAFDNVMVSPGSRDEIPWRDAWFSLVLDLEQGPDTRELHRVLAPGGRILRLCPPVRTPPAP